MNNNSNGSQESTTTTKQKGFISKPSLLQLTEIFFEPFKNQTDPQSRKKECVDIYHYQKISRPHERIRLESEKEKTYFLYDYSYHFFVFFTEKYFRIMDSSGLTRDVSFASKEKIISISFNESNQYLFLVSRISSYMFEINKNHCAQILREEKENFVGAFFIDNKVAKLENNQILCILYTNHFTINELSLSKEKNCFRKKIFHKNIKVDDYFFNQTYYILIVQSNNQFRLYNLKNDVALKQELNFQIADVTANSKFYLEIIYDKLYFIHVFEEGVQLYLLNDFRLAKIIQPITFDQTINSKLVHIQIVDNLLLCYTPNNIGVYDILLKHNPHIGVFEYEHNDPPYDTIIQSQIAFYTNILFTNGRFFELSFCKEHFYNTSELSPRDTFYVLFHREKCKEIISILIQRLIVQFDVSSLSDIFTIVVKHLDKKQVRKSILYASDTPVLNPKTKLNDNCVWDPSVIFFIKMPPFIRIITQEELFGLFDTEAISTALTPEKIIRLMMVIIDLLKCRNISIVERFNKVLMKQINRMSSFGFIDCIIKAKSVPLTFSLGKCLINLGLSGINEKKERIDQCNKELVYNLGLHVLMKLKCYNEVFSQMILNNQFFDAIKFLNMYDITFDNISEVVKKKVYELCQEDENCYAMEQYLKNH